MTMFRRLSFVLCVACPLGATAPLVGCASGSGSSSVDRKIAIQNQEELRRFTAARKLAESAQRTKDPELAIERYRTALATYPELPAAWNNLGVLLLERGRYLEASEAFVEANEHAPQDARPVYNLGLTWEEAGYLSDAWSHYRRALRLDARYLPALRGAIRAARRLGRGDEETVAQLRTALAVESDERWRRWFMLQKTEIEKQAYPDGAMMAPPDGDEGS